MLSRIEAFHVRAAWRMAREHWPKRGVHMVWKYLRSADVLEEVGFQTVEEYIR